MQSAGLASGGLGAFQVLASKTARRLSRVSIMVFPGMIQIEARHSAAVAWHKGTAHDRYEDRYRLLGRGIAFVDALQRGELFAIADGLGDTECAAQAAQLLCDRIIDFFRPETTAEPTTRALLDWVRDVQAQILAWGRDARGWPRGAASATVLWLHDGHAHVVQAGDTWAAIVRSGVVIPLSQRRRSVYGLRACLGADDLELAIETTPFAEGDRFVLATNAVADRLSAQRIASMVEAQPTPSRAAEAVLRAALGDGRSDATVIVIDPEADEPAC
ncbi:MAG: protein phosphatase 2C domain-containing protein [Casimicrobiaceae bacterium]|nr:protein phosphatase 2C domain-containing protein [Casimicrobiaceae bacterium]